MSGRGAALRPRLPPRPTIDAEATGVNALDWGAKVSVKRGKQDTS